jgi:hypothetical protein
MYEQPTTQENLQRRAGMGGTRRGAASPSSSRMLASYLTDIERLLDQHRWDAALREAADLPRISVALADPHLRGSAEAVRNWCQEWIRPPGAERDANGFEYERLVGGLAERSAQLAASEAVPMRALRRLQLHRHVRMAPRGFVARRSGYLPPQASETLALCSALVEGARRWYARSACHDPNVQANLARLAVLR